jgi:outer membrane protein TolC
MNRAAPLLPLLALSAVLSGCAASHAPGALNLEIPENWSNQREQGSGISVSIHEWWAGFEDQTLNQLLADALEANRDIAIARARVREALAGVTAADSLLAPRVDANIAAGRSKDLTRPRPIVDNRTTLIAASWEIDLLGGNRLEAEAAAAQARGAEEGRRAVQVSLAAEIARNYFELRGLRSSSET